MHEGTLFIEHISSKNTIGITYVITAVYFLVILQTFFNVAGFTSEFMTISDNAWILGEAGRSYVLEMVLPILILTIATITLQFKQIGYHFPLAHNSYTLMAKGILAFILNISIIAINEAIIFIYGSKPSYVSLVFASLCSILFIYLCYIVCSAFSNYYICIHRDLEGTWRNMKRIEKLYLIRETRKLKKDPNFTQKSPPCIYGVEEE